MSFWIVTLSLLFSFGHFTRAVDLDHDIEGNIYVVDRAGDMLVKFSPAGDSLRSVSGTGTGTLQFDAPTAVCARRGTDIYVADYNNHRIQRFDRNLDYLASIYTRDDADEQRRFGYPKDVAVTRQGDILIVDSENRRIVKFNSFGEVNRTFGELNAGVGRLIDPSAVEVDDQDNVYVADGKKVMMFDAFGSYVGVLPLPLDSVVTALSVTRDTLVVAQSGEIFLFALGNRSALGRYRTERPAEGIMLAKGRLFAAEEDRIGVYRRKEEE